MKVVARSYFDAVGSVSEGLECLSPSLAVQASKDECDINTIINKYLRTGEPPGQRTGVYMDAAQFGDLHTAMNTVIEAENMFMALPADIRKHFDNDPVKLVEFCSDPSNLTEAVRLGLAIPRQQTPSSASPVQGEKAGTEPAEKSDKPKA